MITQGNHIARAHGAGTIEKSGTGSNFVRVTFRLEDGQTIDWRGYLTEKTRDRTAESLEYMGFDGTDLSTVTKNDVQLVIEPEEYEKDGVKKTAMRVKWVNRLGGRAGATIDAAEKQRIQQDLRGLILGRQSNGPKPPTSSMPGASFDFGANTREPKFGPPAK